MIYFMQPVGGGPVKIGTTENLDLRVRQLEQHYGKPLVILATMPGSYDEERAIHERFAHLRIRGTRRKPLEQFRPADDLMEFIGRPLLVDPNPDAVEAMPSVRSYVSAKIDADVMRIARAVAGLQGISVAQYLSDSLRSVVEKDFRRLSSKMAETPEKK